MQTLAVGGGKGVPEANIFHNNLNNPVLAAGFGEGTRVATANLNRTGKTDLIVAAGPGGLPWVRLMDGDTGTQFRQFTAFEPSFDGGIHVASGDFNRDGVDDIVLSPDNGGGPRVRIISGADNSTLADFYGIDDPFFRGGARVATADVNGDGILDLLVGAGFGGGPRVAVFDGSQVLNPLRSGSPPKLVGDFFMFENSLRNGVFLAGGDVTGDGFDEVVAGGGPGGGPRVLGIDGRGLLQGRQTPVVNLFAGDTSTRGGVHVAVKDLDGDRFADVVAGSGEGSGARVFTYMGKGIVGNATPAASQVLDPFEGFTSGVFVG